MSRLAICELILTVWVVENRVSFLRKRHWWAGVMHRAGSRRAGSGVELLLQAGHRRQRAADQEDPGVVVGLEVGRQLAGLGLLRGHPGRREDRDRDGRDR